MTDSGFKMASSRTKYVVQSSISPRFDARLSTGAMQMAMHHVGDDNIVGLVDAGTLDTGRN